MSWIIPTSGVRHPIGFHRDRLAQEAVSTTMLVIVAVKAPPLASPPENRAGVSHPWRLERSGE